MFTRTARFLTHPLILVGVEVFIVWWFSRYARDAHPFVIGFLGLFVFFCGLRLHRLLPRAPARRGKLPKVRIVYPALVRVVVKRTWRSLSPREAVMRKRLPPQLRRLLSNQQGSAIL